MKALLVLLALNHGTGVYEVKHEVPMPTITFCEKVITPIAGAHYLISNSEDSIYRCRFPGMEYPEISIPL